MGNTFSLPAYGFTFPYGNKDVFVVTEYKNKTRGLARKILRELMIPDDPGVIEELLYWMRSAVLEMKEIKHRRMWEIHGDGFGGKGSFLDDGNTIIIVLERSN